MDRGRERREEVEADGEEKDAVEWALAVWPAVSGRQSPLLA